MIDRRVEHRHISKSGAGAADGIVNVLPIGKKLVIQLSYPPISFFAYQRGRAMQSNPIRISVHPLPRLRDIATWNVVRLGEVEQAASKLDLVMVVCLSYQGAGKANHGVG